MVDGINANANANGTNANANGANTKSYLMVVSAKYWWCSLSSSVVFDQQKCSVNDIVKC